MNLGEKIVFVLITIVFITGIVLGIRLYLWNRKDVKRNRELNQAKRDQARTENGVSE